MDAEDRKAKELNKILSALESVVIAYSGGTDSAFLLKSALDKLGRKNTLAVTAVSPCFPREELESARTLARELGAGHEEIKTEELANPDFYTNPENRCYFCKLELFSKLNGIKAERNLKHVIDGTNSQDLADYRPGRKASGESGIRSPLQEAELTKEDIRKLSKKAGLPTWNKPAMACLASRIPYGERITAKKLDRISRAESFLRASGIKILRVRSHGESARIETSEKEMRLLLEPVLRKKTVKHFKELGFSYITLDMEGYKTGSLNRELKNKT